ncbi:MAG: hypothetical protein JNL63_07250, partial [Bacteroidia bacterium]|nr:hypothetical protein [Bacteroidia bacterium]
MEKISFGSLCFISVVSFFCACGTDQAKHKTSADTIKKDTVEKITATTDSVEVKPKARTINRELDDIARYIAGLKIDTGSKL